LKNNSKICLITGATSGIGKETAIELARQGMHIIFNTRNVEKGNIVRNEIIDLSGNKNVDVVFCDLALMKSVCTFASTIRKGYEKLDILINNAGIWTTRKVITDEGFESQFAVNHLAPFLLTHLLLDLIKKSPAGRIINVSSGIHYRGYLDVSDPEFKLKSYSSINAYTQSKVANILFTRSLAKRLKETDITVNCLAPGWVNTGLFRESNPFVRLSARLMALTPRQGAENTIFLATSGEVGNITGEYFEKKKIKKGSRQSNDMKLAEELWNLSEDYLHKYLTC
jgi:NAD(P)-dependent dehydrogenase (short-subunit alcohol dehydrogenase family)